MIFKSDAMKFYREVGKETITVNETPTIKDVKKFCKQIQSEENGFNKGSKWIKYKQEMNKTGKKQAKKSQRHH